MSRFSLHSKEARLRKRARILQAIRRFFDTRGFLEVETPIRIPAPVPETHIDVYASEDAWLQASPEICMKRMLAAGYPKIYQITRSFRKNERGRFHLPEFTLLEWYEAGRGYLDLMERCEELIGSIARDVLASDTLKFRGQKIALAPPWPRLTVAEAFKRYASESMENALAAGRFDERIACEIDPGLDQATPVFLCDYPAPKASLARLKADNPLVAERFELYLGGMELANAYTELTDASEQRRRFEKELAERASRGASVWPLPETFLADLKHMPPSAGIALGVDRLVMALTDADRIDDVTAFPPEDL